MDIGEPPFEALESSFPMAGDAMVRFPQIEMAPFWVKPLKPLFQKASPV